MKISPIIKSYEHALRARINAARHRQEVLEDAGFKEEAKDEKTRADAFRTALDLYLSWGLE